MSTNPDNLITLTQAANRSPGRPSSNCVWRWCRKGVRSRNGQSVRLQHVRIGGKIFTTEEWLTEFGRQVAAADAEYFDAARPAAPHAATQLKSRSEQERLAAIERAERSLAAQGL